MRVAEGRRLTGRTLWLSDAGVGAELILDEGEDPDRAITLVRDEVRAVFSTLGLAREGPSGEGLVARVHGHGVSLAHPAPIDALYASVDALEHAVARAAAVLEGRALVRGDEKLRDIARDLERERNPRFVALLEAARARGVPLLWDDDELSLGLGARSRRRRVERARQRPGGARHRHERQDHDDAAARAHARRRRARRGPHLHGRAPRGR
jgi:hypothetical protein